jgi:hypothetical protein
MLAVVCGSTRSWPKGFAATRRAKIKIAADKEIAGDVMLNPKGEKRERTIYRAHGR